MLDRFLNSSFVTWAMGLLLLFCIAFWIYYGVWLHRQHLYRGPVSVNVVEWGIPKVYDFTCTGNQPEDFVINHSHIR